MDFFVKMSFREKILFAGLLIVVIPAFIINFVIMPILDNIQNTESRIRKLSKDISQVEYLSGEIKHYQKLGAGTPFQADATIRQILTELGISNDANFRKINSDASGSKYELKIPEMRNDELISLLYKLENNTPVIIVTNLSVNRTYRNSNNIRVEMNLLTQ